ncbi:MAG TPA: hypothetical protein VI958_12965, partial [Acidobacteriota bacterium]
LFLKRNYGDIDKTIKQLNDFVGKGEIEAWRLAEPSERMTRQLDQYHMLDSFYEIQRTAATSDEFLQKTKGIVDAYEKAVKEAASKLPAGANFTDEMADFAQNLAETGGDHKRVFAETYQGWRNTLDKLDEVVNKVEAGAIKMIETLGDPKKTDGFLAIKGKLDGLKKINPFDKVDQVRKQIIEFRDILNNPNVTKGQIIELWNKSIKFGGEEVFSLKALYPNVDLSMIDSKQARKLMWPAYWEWAADTWRFSQSGKYEESLKSLKEIAELFDTKIDDMAGAVKGDSNPFEQLATLRTQQEELEEIGSWMRFERQLGDMQNYKGQDVLLKDVIGDFSEQFPGWEGNKKHIVSALKKDLLDQLGAETSR